MPYLKSRYSDMNLKPLLVIFSFLLFTKPVFAQLADGSGVFEFSESKILKGASMRVFYYKPEGDVKDIPILFVMHGVLRNADVYRDNWIQLAEKYKILVVVPEFSQKNFPGSRFYNFGNLKTKAGELNPESIWTYSLIDPIFDYVVKLSGSNQLQYDLFGHSAGSQFVHRFFLFKENSKANRVVTANAGGYSALDFDTDFPYGIKDMGINDKRLKNIFSKELLIQLGEEDTDPNHENLNREAAAMKQGRYRLERGKYFFEIAKAQAKRLNVPFKWKIRTVPGAAHENDKMAIDAAQYLYGN